MKSRKIKALPCRRSALLSYRASSPVNGLSAYCSSLFVLFSALACLISHFPRASWRSIRSTGWVCGWRLKAVNCPDLSVWGVAASQVDGSLPTVAATQGCPARPGHPAGLRPPGDMLSTAMVGALVRGWRNRSSPRRAESKLLIPQSQDEIQTGGRFVTLLWLQSFLFKAFRKVIRSLGASPHTLPFKENWYIFSLFSFSGYYKL